MTITGTEKVKDLIEKFAGPGYVSKIVAIKNTARSILTRRSWNVLIDTTNGCHLRCSFCSRNNKDIVIMTTAEFNTILGRIHKNVHSLQLSCAWEYSIAKNAADIIRSLGTYTIPQTTIYTNGNQLNANVARAMIETQLKVLVFSIGESKKETYERIHRGGKFAKVVDNIKKINRLKKECNSMHPRIAANLTVIRSNIYELAEFVDMVHALGVEEIRGRHLILNQGVDMNNEIIRDKQHANTMIESAHRKAKNYGMHFSIPRYSEKNTPKSCRAPWFQLYISSNGDVSVCPRIHYYATIGNLVHDAVSTRCLPSIC